MKALAWAVVLVTVPAVIVARDIPFQIAFSHHELMIDKDIGPQGAPNGQMTVSPDGRYVAYQVRQPHIESLSRGRIGNLQGAPDELRNTRVLISRVDKPSTAIDVTMGQGGTTWRPAWSPDGRRLAFYCDADGFKKLWIYDLASQTARKASDVRIRSGTIDIYPGEEPQWSQDGRVVYVPRASETPSQLDSDPQTEIKPAPRVKVFASGSEKRTDHGSLPSPGEVPDEEAIEPSAIVAVNVDSGDDHVVVADTARLPPTLFRVSPTGNWLSYISLIRQGMAKPFTEQTLNRTLTLVTKDGRIVTTVVEGIGIDSAVANYAQYQWHPTEDRLIFWKQGQLWLLEVGSGGPAEPRRIAPEMGYLSGNVYFFTRDGKSIVVGSDPVAVNPSIHKDRTIPAGLAIVSLDGGKTVRARFDTQRWSFVEIIKSSMQTVWQPQAHTLTYVLCDRNTGEKGVFRFDAITGQTRQLWHGRATLTSFAAGQRQGAIVARYMDYSTPEDLYRFSSDFASKVRLSHVEPGYDRIERGAVEVFETTVPMYDGRLEMVRSTVLLPPGARRGDKLPAIVMAYPGGDLGTDAADAFLGGSIGNTTPNMIFTSAGYAVLLTHVKLAPNNEAGNEFKESIDVLLPQIYRAANLGYIDEKRLALSGQSGGGYMTAAMITRTNLFRAAVAVAGEYDLASTVYSLQPASSATIDTVGLIEQSFRFAHPVWTNIQRYLENTPYFQLDKITTPCLIVHGTADSSAPVQDAWVFFNGLYRLGKPAQIAEYAGEDHVVFLWSLENGVDVSKRMLAFFRQHLGDAGP